MPQGSCLTCMVLIKNSKTAWMEFRMFSPRLVNRYERYQLRYTGSIHLLIRSLYKHFLNFYYVQHCVRNFYKIQINLSILVQFTLELVFFVCFWFCFLVCLLVFTVRTRHLWFTQCWFKKKLKILSSYACLSGFSIMFCKFNTTGHSDRSVHFK